MEEIVWACFTSYDVSSRGSNVEFFAYDERKMCKVPFFTSPIIDIVIMNFFIDGRQYGCMLYEAVVERR